MSDSSKNIPDYTMQSRRWNQQKVITSEIAIQIARLVHRQSYGEADLKANEPLTVAADGDAWVITGAKESRYDRVDPKVDGAFEMRISQFDGQILSYAFIELLPRPAASFE